MLLRGDTGDFLVKLCVILQLLNAFAGWYAEFGIAISSCVAESGSWQNHLNYILAINASLLLCEKPFEATIVFDVKCNTSLLNYIQPGSFDNVMFILLYTLWNGQHLLSTNLWRQYSSNKINNFQASILEYECPTCLLTYITNMIFLYSRDTSICRTRISINQSQRFKVYRAIQD